MLLESKKNYKVSIATSEAPPEGTEYRFSIDNGETWFKDPFYLDVRNGDKVLIELVLTNALDYKLTNVKTRELTVSGASPADGETSYNSKVVLFGTEDRVSYFGKNGLGTFSMAISIPDELELLYSTTGKDGVYSTSLPSTLSNDDEVYVKLRVKTGLQNVNLFDEDFSTKLITVSGLNTSTQFETINRNSTINYNGVGTYEVKYDNGELESGEIINTKIYETDMFIYQIHDELKIKDDLVTEEQIHEYIRELEFSTPYGVGMYNNRDYYNDSNGTEKRGYVQVDKTTIGIIGVDSSKGEYGAAGKASWDGFEIYWDANSSRDISYQSLVSLHEIVHNDSYLSTTLLTSYLSTANLFVSFQDRWNEFPELVGYNKYFNDSKPDNKPAIYTKSDIETPWGTLPAGTLVEDEERYSYLFNDAEFMARMMEIYATNDSNDEYLSSKHDYDIASLYEAFESTPYDSATVSQLLIDVFKEEVYAFNTYGGHFNAIGHFVDQTTHIDSVEFKFKLDADNKSLPSPEALKFGEYAKEIYGDEEVISSEWQYATFDVDYKPTSFMFNPTLADGVYDEVHDGRLYYVDIDELTPQEYAFVQMFEYGTYLHVHQDHDNGFIEWEVTAKDVNGEILNVYNNADHKPW